MFVAVAVVVSVLSTAAPQPKADQYAWLERLERWVTAVADHEPGGLDDSVTETAMLSRGDLQTLWLDTAALLKLMQCGGVSRCRISVKLPSDKSAQPWRRVDKTAAERLERLVREVATRFHGINGLVKRGAVLHTDVAILGADITPPANPPVVSNVVPDQVVLRFKDGRQQSYEHNSVHWEFARMLLDHVSRPAADDMVRAWYHATVAWLQHKENLYLAHLEHGRQIFPNDAELLFQLGCMHETYASVGVQTVMESLDHRQRRFFDVQGRRAELEDAESFLKKAVAAQPSFADANLHLGRVLGLRGRHADAVAALDAAKAATDDPLLLYYAELFLGAEHEALRHFDEARQAFEHAASLYPAAQSPYLALSQLAHRQGDRAGALRAIDSVLQRPSKDEADDPWWIYTLSHGRDADARLRKVYERVARDPS